MQGNEQEYLFKDISIIISALFGLVILIVIQLKNMGIRFRPFGRRKSDFVKASSSKLKYETNELSYDKDWSYAKEGFEISPEGSYVVWFIGVFHIRRLNINANLHNLHGHYWYKLSNSRTTTEKIMAPIFRKVVNKYKNKFDTEKSIQFNTTDYEDCQLYTWLKNESHIHTVIYAFLDECIYIAHELQIKPSLIVTLTDLISLEIVMPHNEMILLFEKDFKDLYAVDFFVEEEFVRIKLWVAFSKDKIPAICVHEYSKANIFSDGLSAA